MCVWGGVCMCVCLGMGCYVNDATTFTCTFGSGFIGNDFQKDERVFPALVNIALVGPHIYGYSPILANSLTCGQVIIEQH